MLSVPASWFDHVSEPLLQPSVSASTTAPSSTSSSSPFPYAATQGCREQQQEWGRWGLQQPGSGQECGAEAGEQQQQQQLKLCGGRLGASAASASSSSSGGAEHSEELLSEETDPEEGSTADEDQEQPEEVPVLGLEADQAPLEVAVEVAPSPRAAAPRRGSGGRAHQRGQQQRILLRRGLPQERLSRSGGGRLLLFLLRERTPEQLEHLRTERATTLAERFERHVLACLFFLSLTLLALVVLATRSGGALVSSRRSPECEGPLRDWWLGKYLLLQVWAWACLPLAACLHHLRPETGAKLVRFVCPVVLCLPMFFCLGARLGIHSSSDCRVLHTLPAQAMDLQAVSLTLLLMSLRWALAAQKVVETLSDALRHTVPYAEASNLSVELADGDVPAGQECVICLGCVEDDEAGHDGEDCCARQEEGEEGRAGASTAGALKPRWRQVHCGHRFHEKCLSEWLEKAQHRCAKHCPVCRAKLRRMPQMQQPPLPSSPLVDRASPLATSPARQLWGEADGDDSPI